MSSARWIDRRVALAVLACLVAGLLITACSAVTLPRNAAVAERTGRRMVVLVPGITGVELVDRNSGEIVWGRGANLIAPRDRGYRLALPIADSEPPRPDGGGLVPGTALERIRLGPINKPVYGPIVDLFEAHGWKKGDLADPSATENLFLFAYDWRLDNSGSARRLAAALEAVAERRGAGEQPITLICQSNGAHICRYLVKYGKATLAEAESGRAESPSGIRIEQVVLVGNANGGSLRILSFLNRGRGYVRVIGRHFSPEVFFTFESLYQDLPAYRDDLFVDPAGQPVDVDLYDPANWRRYGWSIYEQKVAQRLTGTRRTDLFADAERRDAHLVRQLARARRFQAALKRDLPVGPTRYFLIQNRAAPTPDRGVLAPTATGWETLITGDPALRRLDLSDDVAATGDGHATHSSQLWLAPAEIEAFGDDPYYVDGDHFEMILELPTLERLLAIVGGDQPGFDAR